jgi:predicted alpha/beta-hydrolase family hydrolase
MPERMDLGSCTVIRHDGSPERCAVLLPGMVYPTRAPVLWFAREAAMALGYSALEVLGEPMEHADKLGWERECAERAIAEAGSARVVVIGKSLASLLAAEISDRNLPAAWLTPPLTEPSMIDALTRVRKATLLLGGTADPMWRADAIADNPALEVVELRDVDHALQVAGDPVASLHALRQMTEALTGWLQRIR